MHSPYYNIRRDHTTALLLMNEILTQIIRIYYYKSFSLKTFLLIQSTYISISTFIIFADLPSNSNFLRFLVIDFSG